jgi:hypothetical protein
MNLDQQIAFTKADKIALCISLVVNFAGLLLRPGLTSLYIITAVIAAVLGLYFKSLKTALLYIVAAPITFFVGYMLFSLFAGIVLLIAIFH